MVRVMRSLVLVTLCILPAIHCWGESLANLVMDDYSDLDKELTQGETISSSSCAVGMSLRRRSISSSSASSSPLATIFLGRSL